MALDKLGISPSYYSLDGDLFKEGLVLYYNNYWWDVFFQERGTKSDERMFVSESDACNYIYDYFQNMVKENPYLFSKK